VSDGISSRQWVGIDLHLHRSVICRIDERGNELECVRIDNDPKTLVVEVRKGLYEPGRGGRVTRTPESLATGGQRAYRRPPSPHSCCIALMGCLGPR
jgi:hypothetical protein